MNRVKYYLIIYIIFLTTLIFWDYKLLNIWYLASLLSSIYLYVYTINFIYLANLIINSIIKFFYLSIAYIRIYFKTFPWKLKFLIRKAAEEMEVTFTPLSYVVDVFLCFWLIYVIIKVNNEMTVYGEEEFDDLDEELEDYIHTEHPLFYDTDRIDSIDPPFIHYQDIHVFLDNEFYHYKPEDVRDDILENTIRGDNGVETIEEVLDYTIWIEKSIINPVVRFLSYFIPNILKNFFTFNNPRKVYDQIIFLLAYLPSFFFVFFKYLFGSFFNKK